MSVSAADAGVFRGIVHERQPVLISSHVHPDPDAIGSVLACRLILASMGVESLVVLSDPVPSRCRQLPGADAVVTYPVNVPDRRFDCAVILDCGSLSRIGDVAALLVPGAQIINLDHHVSNEQFGRLNVVDAGCAATSELLFTLCRRLQVELTPEIADCLYAGILSDTGRFRHGMNSGRVFDIAAVLVNAGARVTQVTNDLYFDHPSCEILKLGAVYSTLELFYDGQVSTMFVRADHLLDDPDSAVDSALAIRGVRVAAMLSEAPEGKIRVSLRSKDTVDVARIAESFGGGGHERAAGFRMKGTLESVRERLLPVLAEALQTAVKSRLAAAM